MKKIKWTLKLLQEEALKYQTKGEFQNNSPNAYSSASKQKLIKVICSHMVNGKIKWTKENVIELALKYETFTKFTKNEVNAYDVASKRLFCIDEIKALYTKKHLPTNLFWTSEKIKEEALKYKSRREFGIKNQSAYKAAHKLGIIDIVCNHMTWLSGQTWNAELVLIEALKYNYRNNFREKSLNAYRAAIKLNILNEVCQHMEESINQFDFPRIIYIYEFEDNSIYIGLTKNFKRRHTIRLYKNKDCVMNHIKNTGLQPTIKFLTEFIPAEEAQIKEQEFIDDYKNKGYNILNIAKGGSLGGGSYHYINKNKS